ncbi:putative MFS family arabinose efflux permease [Planomicrobium stackebrandtii]|uniref:MFS family arabinose efflux permease n=1 Tax=Planomicrobium stackebrandtii TaxID=253160 RepID=A0ABU0GPH3_9BACL|nr:MFS transporter [Planomicrobium stackebrandtii]MDQ0427264.1 putative MFS family arabinose efflux permease [Planomicrobium stackebrandtii]
MWKIIMPGIAMVAVTYAFARYSFGLFLPDISSTLNLSASQSGYVSSAAYIAYTLALLTASIFIHKFSARHVILLSGSTACLGMLGMAASQGFYMLTFSAFVAGLGSGWVSPAFSQVVSYTMKSNLQDKGNTWINTGTSFGIFLTGPVALMFTEQWRWSYVLFAVMATMVFWWNASVIKEEEQPFSINQSSGFNFRLLIKARFLILASVGIGFSSSIYWTFSRSYLTAIHGFSANESVVFWIIMGGAGIIGGIAGAIIQTIGLNRSYRLGVVVVSASILTLTIPNHAAIYLSALLFGISFIFMTGLFIVWGTRDFPDAPSTGVSISFFSLGIGQSLGSMVAGILIVEISYSLAFIVFAGVGFLFLFCKTTVSSDG